MSPAAALSHLLDMAHWVTWEGAQDAGNSIFSAIPTRMCVGKIVKWDILRLLAVEYGISRDWFDFLVWLWVSFQLDSFHILY